MTVSVGVCEASGVRMSTSGDENDFPRKILHIALWFEGRTQKPEAELIQRRPNTCKKVSGLTEGAERKGAHSP